MKIYGLAVLLLSGLVFSGCTGCVNKGVAVMKEINFKEVQWYAGRAKAVYSTEKDIRQAFPQTVRVATVGDTEIQYFLERFPEKKLQVITVRGTDNLKDALEDAEYLQAKDGKLAI